MSFTKQFALQNFFRGESRIFRRRERQPSRRGRQHTNLPDFPQKIKKIFFRRGDPPLFWKCQCKHKNSVPVVYSISGRGRKECGTIHSSTKFSHFHAFFL